MDVTRLVKDGAYYRVLISLSFSSVDTFLNAQILNDVHRVLEIFIYIAFASYAYQWCDGEAGLCNSTLVHVSGSTFERDQLETCHAYTVNVKAKTEAGLGDGEQIVVYTAVKGLLTMKNLPGQGNSEIVSY